LQSENADDHRVEVKENAVCEDAAANSNQFISQQ
jgi:hypothetical protein